MPSPFDFLNPVGTVLNNSGQNVSSGVDPAGIAYFNRLKSQLGYRDLAGQTYKDLVAGKPFYGSASDVDSMLQSIVDNPVLKRELAERLATGSVYPDAKERASAHFASSQPVIYNENSPGQTITNPTPQPQLQTQVQNPVENFFAPAYEQLRQGINRQLGEAYQRAATRAVQQGSFGSPAQEYLFRPIEQSAQQALSSGSANLGLGQANAFLDLNRLNQQNQQFNRQFNYQKGLNEQMLDLQRAQAERQNQNENLGAGLGLFGQLGGAYLGGPSTFLGDLVSNFLFKKPNTRTNAYNPKLNLPSYNNVLGYPNI